MSHSETAPDPVIQALLGYWAAADSGIEAGGALAVLDIGGGAGSFSAVWLQLNQDLLAVQLDWPNVNRIAERRMSNSGLKKSRFGTIDDDYHTVDLGHECYDYIIFSNIAHQDSPDANRAVFRKIRAALKPRSCLVVSEFVLDDSRRGHLFAQLFHLNMLIQTEAGAAWCTGDYQSWLSEAGFTEIQLQPAGGPSTPIYAR